MCAIDVDVTDYASGDATSVRHSSDPAMSGFRAPWRPTFFPGLLDDLRVYDRALSPDEIRALALADQ
jgi:hypothetical protein